VASLYIHAIFQENTCFGKKFLPYALFLSILFNFFYQKFFWGKITPKTASIKLALLILRKNFFDYFFFQKTVKKHDFLPNIFIFIY
jgi:hypothetical protein